MIKKISITLIVVLLAAGLFTGAVFAKEDTAGKSDVDMDPNHRMLIGLILEIGDSDFTVEGLNGEHHIITVTEETIFRIWTGEGPEEATFSDLEFGLYIGVSNHEDPSGEFSARLVVILPENFDPSQLSLVRVTGEVFMVSTGAGFFKIETPNGEKLTFYVDEKTRYAGGVESLEDLEKGDKVAVVARQQENGDLLARAVATRKVEPRPFAQTNGKLTASSGDEITITDRRGLEHTFSVTENTTFKDRAGEVGGIEDLEVGMVVIIVHLRDTEVNEAEAVLVADEAILSLKRTVGRIKSINKNELTLDVNGDVMHFSIDKNTRINGWNISGLEDLEKDMRVRMLYQEDDSGKLIAKSITGSKRQVRDQ